MEFLLDNPLATMEGPIFLIMYAFVIFFSVTTLGYFKSKLDLSDRMALPAIPPEIDPFEIAYLRGGANELARALIFSLRKKGSIAIESDGKNSIIRRAPDGDAARLSANERTTLDWIGGERAVSSVFSGPAPLTESLSGAIHGYQLGLEGRQLLVGSETNAALDRWKWMVAAVISGLGFYKILAATANGNWNIVYTIILGTVGCTAALIVGRSSRLTALGKTYLERLRAAFSRISDPGPLSFTETPSQQSVGFATVDPLMVSVGVFGTAALAGTMYGDYNDAFRKSEQDSYAGSSCGSSCGSSSSSSSGDSGGSSCGGGSCGGGCGGCGGS